MRNIFLSAACFLLLFATAAHAEIKGAVVNMDEVAAACDAIKAGEQAMRRDFDARKAALDSSKAAIDKNVADLRQRGSVTQAEREALIQAGEEYNKMNMEFITEYEKAQRRVRSDIDLLIREAAGRYAKEKGYNLVMDSALTKHADLPDISKDVLKKTNELWRSMNK